MPDSPHEHYRIAGYLSAMSVFGTAVAGAAALGRVTGRDLPAAYALPDLALGAIATHKFARLMSKDGVTTPLRAPFTEFEENTGSAEVAESPRPEPARHVVGELITCPFCLAPWIATAYVAGLALAPRVTRAWAAVFSVVGGSDFLQHAYAHVRTD
ncbi:DUF1360 domain-containing protein [Nocardioides sp. KR10-350]|uniref:DUF1360 domain-containing protein n=1 Tax=Nocardioides cheoyonin TaxID=3156615 RepID=UPI0032B49B3B